MRLDLFLSVCRRHAPKTTVAAAGAGAKKGLFASLGKRKQPEAKKSEEQTAAELKEKYDEIKSQQARTHARARMHACTHARTHAR